MSTQEAIDTNPLSALGEALESAAEAFGEATTDARESAKVAAKKVRQTFGAGVYKTAYGLSYGVVFGAVFLTELLPEDSSLRRGFTDGASDALDAVASRRLEAFTDTVHEEDEDPAGTNVHETGSANSNKAGFYVAP